MADFAALGRADETRFTDTIWWEVVVQHERIFALTLYGIDELSIATGTQSRNDNGLCLAACEDGGAMRAWQNTNLNVDRSHRALITAIDTRLTANNALTNNGLLQFGQGSLDLISGPASIFAAGQCV